MPEATREVYFNVTTVWPIYALLLPTSLVFLYGIYRHVRAWRKIGGPKDLFDRPWARLKGTFEYVLLHKGLLRDSRYRSVGLGHLLFFTGFFVLFVATLVVAVHEDLKIRIMTGDFYLYFQSLTVDIFAALAMIGVGFVLYQRYLVSDRLQPGKREDAFVAVSFFVILVTGFFLEGMRIELTRDVWGNWSPVGKAFGLATSQLLDRSVMLVVHWWTWWFHLILVYVFLASLPYTKLIHIFTSPLNIYFRDLEGDWARLETIDLESESTFGARRLEDFTWKDLLSLDACTECARCEVNCPAFLSNKPLSPKEFILDLRDEMFAAERGPQGDESASEPENSGLIGPVIREETLWSCTTCGACMQQCPVLIEPVPMIMAMRRFLVMEQADFPEDLQAMVRNLEARGHPYSGVSSSRTDWAQGLDVPSVDEVDDFEVLYWVGCAGAFNERNKETTRAVARCLQRAGIRFAILGKRERCSGDPARRIGHEYLFEMLARQNIETLNPHREKKIVTSCPHCFSCLKNEYPQFGGDFEVVHHSQFLAQLVSQGKLVPQQESQETVVFHDPCYLGRYNKEFEAPRQVLDALAGDRRVELEMSREKSLCCGGGGGFSFMEETTGKRMSHTRTQQIIESGAQRVAVGCPFCMAMIDDAAKTMVPDGSLEVLDIAELLEESTRFEEGVSGEVEKL